MTTFNESAVEEATMGWLSNLGWETVYGPDIAPDGPAPERDNYRQVFLESAPQGRPDVGLTPGSASEALEDTIRRITNPDGATLDARNRSFHLDMINGITVEHRSPDGTISGVPARIVDFENPDENDWLAVNQFTAQENLQSRRGDIRLFVNGLRSGCHQSSRTPRTKARTSGRHGSRSGTTRWTCPPCSP